MAHCFCEAPAHLSISQALRWAQVLGYDGSEALAEAICATRLGQCFENESFWSTVVLFLTRHPMLDPDYIDPIIEYFHQQKYLLQQVQGPDGEMAETTPAEPNLSLKSRSIVKLINQVDEWQAYHNKVARKENEGQLLSKSSVSGFSCVEKDEGDGGQIEWRVQQILTHKELSAEGKYMRHCVTSYSSN
jgi:hypothetical protein